MTGLRVGVDVGGTFTDFVLADVKGPIRLYKRLSTPRDPSIGVVKGLTELCEKFGVRMGDIDAIVHGTTVVANAIIERKGATTAVLTTKGFRDVIEIGRESRYDIYDLFIDYPKPLSPRYLRFELDERVLSDGSIRRSPEPDEVRAIAHRCIAAGTESIAVCFLHSFRNPVNELAVRDLLAREFPALQVSLSSEVAPEIREYERFSTTVANAYVHPLVRNYLRKLQESLQAEGYRGSLHIMLSHGGLATPGFTEQFPIHLVESGPAGGAEGGAYIARQSGTLDQLAFDMGGTTAKACMIDSGYPTYKLDVESARIERFKKGSGLPLRLPAVDMIEVGAGGGSIARLNALGLLDVGPQSAAAEPGPACYGLGGTEPTVTDANLVLGYLDPLAFLGGEMALKPELSGAALERISKPLGVQVHEVAAGIVDLVNEKMATAARLHVAEHGQDPQRYALIAFGGGGPVHGYGVAKALRIGRIVYPMAAGVFCALGMLIAPPAQRLARSYVCAVNAIDWAHVRHLLQDMRAEATSALCTAGAVESALVFKLSVEIRYTGQGHEVEINVPPRVIDENDAEWLERTFEAEYMKLFSTRLDGVGMEVLTWRLSAEGVREDLSPNPWESGEPGQGASADEARTGMRQIYLPEVRQFASVPVYSRYRLRPGMVFEGPAIVEEKESTVVLNGLARVTVDEHRSIVAELQFDAVAG